MGANRESQSTDIKFWMAVARWFRWLADLGLGRYWFKRILVDGISLRFSGTGCFVVVRGLDAERMERVVIFGQSQTLYGALVNVTHALQKEQWKRDKFNNFVP